MIPASFDYVRPGSLEEVLAILRDREGEAKLLSGGYSLLPLMKLRLAQPALLVDLQAVAGLDGIARADDGWRIGAVPPTARSSSTMGWAPGTPPSATPPPGSATRRSATGARSAARAPTPTRAPTGRPSCRRSARRSCAAAPVASA